MVYTNGSQVFLFWDRHFQDFYPAYRDKVNAIINDNCTAEFRNYKGKNATCTPEWLEFGWNMSVVDCAGHILLNCIMDALPETAKSDMTSAGTFLGLLPIILAMIGSTVADVGLLALRRPLLAAIVGLASPAVNPMRFLDWKDPLEILRLHHRPPIEQRLRNHPWGRLKPTVDTVERAFDPLKPVLERVRTPLVSYWMTSLLEYGLAVAALINLIAVSIDLTRKAIVCNQPNRDYQVLVWAVWAFALHLAGYLSLRWRVKLVPHRTNRFSGGEKHFPALLLSWFQDAIKPSASQSPATIRVRRQTQKFVGLAWLASLATVVHIAYGSQNFAQMLFLSGTEGFLVLVRCMASVVLCRIILVYELQGMGETVLIEEVESEHHANGNSLDHGSFEDHSLSVLQRDHDSSSGITLVRSSYEPVQIREQL